MKTASLVFFLMIGLTGSVLAQETPVATQEATATAQPAAAKPASEGLELDVNGGYVVAGNFSLSTEYPEGGGGGAAILFPITHNFSLGLMGGFYTYGQSTSSTETETFGPPIGGSVTITSASSETTQSVEAMLAAKYYFDATGIKPYVFGGAGIADYSLTETELSAESGSAPSTTTTAINSQIDPMFTAGFGLNFPVANDLGVFIQGKESFILVPTTSVTTSNSTLTETGTVGGVVTDTTFEGGLSFDIR